MRDNDTIAAIATANGRSAIGIIRISGPNIGVILNKHAPNIRPRRATLIDVCDDKDEKIDSIIMIYYKSPHSYTGEDLLEIQTHGNPIILRKITRVFFPSQSLPAQVLVQIWNYFAVVCLTTLGLLL